MIDDETTTEYQLCFDDGDPVHSGSLVRGPLEHALGVLSSRSDPANVDSFYGTDIHLEERQVTPWTRVTVPEDDGVVDLNPEGVAIVDGQLVMKRHPKVRLSDGDKP
jgi:hypothetical protein